VYHRFLRVQTVRQQNDRIHVGIVGVFAGALAALSEPMIAIPTVHARPGWCCRSSHLVDQALQRGPVIAERHQLQPGKHSTVRRGTACIGSM